MGSVHSCVIFNHPTVSNVEKKKQHHYSTGSHQHWKIQVGQKNMNLIFENSKIKLTNTEADLLALLHESANDILDRDVILNKVWGDNGDYVGRTLDVFISKLRAKLGSDENVRIVNIRGKGYKLVLND